MLVNNETGVIQPIKEIANIAHDNGALLFTDATQAVGKISVDVIDLDDGGMGSIEFVREGLDREFGTAILNAVTYDIDDRKIMIELSVDSEDYLYQLDAFTEDFLPLKADLGANIKINDFHSPPIYE